MPAATFHVVRPLTEITGVRHDGGTHYTVECRDCGELAELAIPQALTQAGLQRDRHLAVHLQALAAEIAEAAR